MLTFVDAVGRGPPTKVAPVVVYFTLRQKTLVVIFQTHNSTVDYFTRFSVVYTRSPEGSYYNVCPSL